MNVAFVLAALVATAGFVPVAVETAEACRPYSWYCVLTGNYYYGCGGSVPNAGPLLQCVRDASVPIDP